MSEDGDGEQSINGVMMCHVMLVLKMLIAVLIQRVEGGGVTLT